jgi:two-component system NarL family sensor kinase
MWIVLAVLAVVVVGAGALALRLIVSERRRHEEVEADNARLLEEAREREGARARLSEQLVNAEQDERRRLALFLHDGPVQNMSGISLMLDAALGSITDGRADEARQVVESALQRHRETIRSLRDLSFNLEPVVLRDQGFEAAVRGLTDRIESTETIRVDLDVAVGDELAENAQVTLYQIIREALSQAIRRGPPSSVAVAISRSPDGSVETVIADDGAGERRRASFEAIAERTQTLNAKLTVEGSDRGGTAVRVVLPPYVAQR